MRDQLVPAGVGELVQIPLQVCPCHLGPGPDGTSKHLVCHSGRLEVEEMRTRFINTGNKQSHTIRPLSVLLSVELGTVTDLRDDAVHGDGTTVGHSGTEGLLLHEVGEHTGVRRQTGDSHAHMRVDFNDLSLIR